MSKGKSQGKSKGKSQEKSLDQRIEELGYEVVIGLETHVQLNTKTKLFCSCDNEESTTPNENICAVCTGQMGTLPELNKAAVEKSVVLGKGFNSEINCAKCCFFRENSEKAINIGYIFSIFIR